MSEDYDQAIQEHAKGEVITRESLEDTVPFLQYATNDVDVIEQVKDDVDLKHLLPLYSQLNRLTKVDDKEKKHFKHRVARIFNISKIFTTDDDYDSGKWGKLQANETFLSLIVNDSHKGFKMDKLTKQEKHISFTPEKKEKKGLWQ